MLGNEPYDNLVGIHAASEKGAGIVRLQHWKTGARYAHLAPGENKGSLAAQQNRRTLPTGVLAAWQRNWAPTYVTHKTKKVRDWLLLHPRFHYHFTPTCSSWTNLVERFFAALTEQQLRRGTHRSVPALEKAIRQYLDNHNDTSKPYRWTKSAAEIIESVNSVLKRINDSGH